MDHSIERQAQRLERFVDASIVSGVVVHVAMALVSRTVPENATARHVIDLDIATAVHWSSFIAGAAIAVRGLFPSSGPQSAFDKPMCKIGVYASLLPFFFQLLCSTGIIVPTYLHQGLVLAIGANAQIVLMTALGGKHGNLPRAVKYSFVSFFLVLCSASLAPGAINGLEPLPAQLATRRRLMELTTADGSSYVSRMTHRPGHAYPPLPPVLSYIRQRWLVYSVRSVWPPGPLGAVQCVFHEACGALWLLALIWAKNRALADFRARVPIKRLRAVILAIELLHAVCPPLVLLLCTAAHPTRVAIHVAAFLLLPLQHSLSPLVLLLCIEAVHEKEQEIVVHLHDAERARRHAEDLIDIRRQFLRYLMHEVRVPMQTTALGLEDLQASLAAPLSEAHCAAVSPSGGAADATVTFAKRTVDDCLETIDLMTHATSAARHTIDSTLTLERIDSGEYTIELRPTCVRSSLLAVYQMMAPLARNAGITLTVAIPQKGDTAAASVPCNYLTLSDDLKLQQVLRNCVSNALKFTPVAGSVTVSLSIPSYHRGSFGGASSSSGIAVITTSGIAGHSNGMSIEMDQPRGSSSDVSSGSFSGADGQELNGQQLQTIVPWEKPRLIKYRLYAPSPLELQLTNDWVDEKIVVTDTGCGMTQADIGSLFQPFQQIEAGSRQKGGGTGLGLHISKRIVEALGGTLTAESAGPGQGSAFTIHLRNRVCLPVTSVPSGGSAADRGSQSASSSLVSSLAVEGQTAWGKTLSTGLPRSQSRPMVSVPSSSASGLVAMTSASDHHPTGSGLGPAIDAAAAEGGRASSLSAGRGSSSGLRFRPKHPAPPPAVPAPLLPLPPPPPANSTSASTVAPPAATVDRAPAAAEVAVRKRAGPASPTATASASGSVPVSGSGSAAVSASASSPPQNSAAAGAAGASQPSAALRFLIVDDVGSNRLMLKRTVLRLFPGSAITEAADGQEALLTVQEETARLLNRPQRQPQEGEPPLDPQQQTLRGTADPLQAHTGGTSSAAPAVGDSSGTAPAPFVPFDSMGASVTPPAAPALAHPPSASAATPGSAGSSSSGINPTEGVPTAPAARPWPDQPFDVVLMDGSMPVMDGYEATRRLREQLGFRGVIIGVTGNAMSDDQQAFVAAGADCVHVKPVSSAALAVDIRRLTGGAGTRA